MDDNEINVLNILSIVISSIAILFLLLFVIAYSLEKSLRYFANDLVLYLCCSEMLGHIFSLLNDPKKESFKCLLHAGGKTIFPLMSIFFATEIQFTSYGTTKGLFTIEENEKCLRLWYIFISILVPLIFGVV